VANRLLQLCWLFPTDCLLSHIIVKNVHDLSHLIIKFTHMTPIELALTSLSEATSITLHRERDSQGFPELKRDTTDAGRSAGKARKALEEDLGKSVVGRENYQKRKKVKGKGKENQQPPLLEE
jgi:hypothetical protein